ncbi:MAG: hypothetical protein GY820_13145 [Gammaproteobacteria bacterium]|nr:hypothetical protein [Gammaproteobacteria bacterium]
MKLKSLKKSQKFKLKKISNFLIKIGSQHTAVQILTSLVVPELSKLQGDGEEEEEEEGEE